MRTRRSPSTDKRKPSTRNCGSHPYHGERRFRPALWRSYSERKFGIGASSSIHNPGKRASLLRCCYRSGRYRTWPSHSPGSLHFESRRISQPRSAPERGGLLRRRPAWACQSRRASLACGRSRRGASPRTRSDSASRSRYRRESSPRTKGSAHIRPGFRRHLAVARTEAPSVIIFRPRNQTPAAVNSRLFRVISDCGSEPASGAIIIVEDQGYRVRRLPIRR